MAEEEKANTAGGVDDYPGRLLQQAAIYNNTGFLESVLQGEERHNINAQDSFGRTALYTSVTNNSLDCAKMLLEAGADPNIKCGPQCGCMSPLHAAALDDKHQFVSLLLCYGASLDQTDASGEKPFDLALKNRSDGCVKVIMEEMDVRQKRNQDLENCFRRICEDGPVEEAEKLAKVLTPDIVRQVINTTPEGQTSLLHRSCEAGDTDRALFLLSHGADAYVHPVTAYSPLHSAVAGGHQFMAEQLLQHFPELAQSPTIECTLPVHIAASEGNVDILRMFLNFPYPDECMQMYRESQGDRLYRLGFPVNAKDSKGQSILHIAASKNHVDFVRTLLRFRVKVLRRDTFFTSKLQQSQQNMGGSSKFPPSVRERTRDLESPEVREATETLYMGGTPGEEELCPVEIDNLDLDGNTPLHLALKGDGSNAFHQVASLLLQSSANPNKPLISSSGNTTPLMEACQRADVKMMNLLLKHKGQDPDLKVLSAAVLSQHDSMISTILKYRSYQDSEYKTNKLAVLEYYYGEETEAAESYDTLCSVVFPSHPVVINWYDLKLNKVLMPWLVQASYMHNTSLPAAQSKLSLYAITRIDLSKNSLEMIPAEIFTLKSLRLLNASHNNIRSLPGSDILNLPNKTGSDSGRGASPQQSPTEAIALWHCPMLKEVNLSKNKLQFLPGCLFKCSSLNKINVSHNQLEALPMEMWTSPALMELNLSYNKLKDMPSKGENLALSPNTPSTIEESLQSSNEIEETAWTVTSKGSNPATPRRSAPDSGTGTANSATSSSSNQSQEDELAKPKPYEEGSVTHHSLWVDRLQVHQTSLSGEDESGCHKLTPLVELNLSYNKFEKVPPCLACLAPQLNKLDLTGNGLNQIGPLCNYPANLKWLNLSYNQIMTFVQCDSARSTSDDEGVFERWLNRSCFNPYYQEKQTRSKSKNTPSLSLSRNFSNTSLMSTTSSVSVAGPCPHRSHQNLDQLKTLLVVGNRLEQLSITLETTESQLTSSGEEKTTSPGDRSRSSSMQSQQSLQTSSPSLSTNVANSKPNLLFPNLSMYDASNNSLASLPPEISEMAQLTEFKICNNKKIKELPSEMGLLRKLWNLDISGCPVERSLQGLLGEKARKTAAILGYLKSIKEEATLYNRMKLMFVGVQGIGKTSLLNQLRRAGKTSPQSSKNWAQRMGHTTMKDKDSKGENISTVGVDIGDLVLQRSGREVVFKTWDFGGQREYYATHQYFLSKRALYLVVWRITDGEKGVNSIHQWLVNIQARAANAPVIIVATHLDQVTKKKFPPTYVSDLRQLIIDKYMRHPEPEKCGLPRVVGQVEISCRSKPMFNSHMGDLLNLLWERVSSEMLPGSRDTRLLDQKVPSTYVHLQDVVSIIGEQRKQDGKDPVLHTSQYRPLVMQKMEELYGTSFRDVAELNQATQFLHENGVLLHYDDVNLQDIYFLDPQWLCDMLANVVTIREINSLAKSGIMRTDDLKLLFKNAAFKPEDIKMYIIDLLNKFEVALLWDETNLLIPSLLPTEEDLRCAFPKNDIRIPVCGSQFGKGLKLGGQMKDNLVHLEPVQPPKTLLSLTKSDSHPAPLKEQTPVSDHVDSCLEESIEPTIDHDSNPAVVLSRLYLMSYFPSGFWPRLVSRLLGDSAMHELVMELYQLPKALRRDQNFMRQRGYCPQWRCWQTGLELKYLGATVARVKEAAPENPDTLINYRQCKLLICHEVDMSWRALNMFSTSILEILIPAETLVIQFDPDDDKQYDPTQKSFHDVRVQPDPKASSALLAKVVDHVDTLLEDWYPDLGVRFAQDSQGMYLITRVVPCTRCLLQQKEFQNRYAESPEAWSMVELGTTNSDPRVTEPILIDQTPRPIPDTSFHGSLDVHSRGSPSSSSDASGELRPGSAPPESTGSGSSSSSGSRAWVDSMFSSGKRVMETVGTLYNRTAEATGLLPRFDRGWPTQNAEDEGCCTDHVHCYLVEQCLQAAQLNKIVFCPLHGNMGPYFVASHDGHVLSAHVAPDAVFQDIGDEYLIEPDHVTRGRFLGKGSFGAVFAGSVIHKQQGLVMLTPGHKGSTLKDMLAGMREDVLPMSKCFCFSFSPETKSGDAIDVAMKMLQPVDPGAEASAAQKQQYQAERQRWEKDPMKHACEAYLNARKELSILLSLHHPNIVPLVGVSLQPLCLILSLAPLGALNDRLSDYHRAGAHLPLFAVQKVILQVASALEYLHSSQIIYRDLKSENVLVWSLPSPDDISPLQIVDVKLADYGVSRSVLPSGTKGFAGTPPFIAPEIIQHNGEEAYTEKVDCFSFGMFMYELLTLKMPFEDQETGAAAMANIKGFVLGGGRPSVSPKELTYPTHFLDLMTLCWSHDPSDRPSASQIVTLASAPEFCHLHDVMSLNSQSEVVCAISGPVAKDTAENVLDDSEWLTSEAWVSTKCEGQGQLAVYSYQNLHCVQSKSLPVDGLTISCMCVAGQWVWGADTSAMIHVYSLREYKEVLKFSSTPRPNVRVRGMVYSKSETRVFILLDSGRLVLCNSDIANNPAPSYSPVKTECPGNKKPNHCLLILPKPNESSELWCGQSQGRISVWNFDNTEGSLQVVPHEPIRDSADVFLLVNQAGDPRAVWSYVYPGSVVYRWDALAERKCIVGRLDISKVIPSEDQTASVVTEHGNLKCAKCQVTAMCALSGYLYIATTWGCLIVIDNTSMRPISVSRCHGDEAPYVRAILPLIFPGSDSTSELTATEYEVPPEPAILTIGKGYRNVMLQHLHWLKAPAIALKQKPFMLSWLAKDWTITGCGNMVNVSF